MTSPEHAVNSESTISENRGRGLLSILGLAEIGAVIYLLSREHSIGRLVIGAAGIVLAGSLLAGAVSDGKKTNTTNWHK